METIQKRRKFRVVNRSLQYRFLAAMLIYMFILTAFFAFTVFVPEIMQLNDESLSLEVRSAVADRILLKHAWVWPVILVLVVLMGMHSFLAFHKVIGPLHRFRVAFEQVREGDLGLTVRIREKDFLHLEEESLNAMLETIARRIGSIMEASQEAMESWQRIERREKERLDGSEPDMEALRLHRQSIEKLRETVQFFRLRNADNRE